MRQPGDFRCPAFAIVWVAALCAGPAARGGELWTWTHEGAGLGTANVFDGGPVDTSMGMASGPHDANFSFAAVDRTRTGSQGATYSTAGRSTIDEYFDAALGGESLIVDVRFSTGYNGGSTSQGDHTGGEGGGSIWSIVEFVMPRDEVNWFVDLRVLQTAGFTGSSYVKFENVSRNTTLLEIASTFSDSRTLTGQAGDIIRITSQLDGQGFFPPQVTLGFPTYSSRLYTFFSVPEPPALVLAMVGAFLVRRKSRRT